MEPNPGTEGGPRSTSGTFWLGLECYNSAATHQDNGRGLAGPRSEYRWRVGYVGSDKLNIANSSSPLPSPKVTNKNSWWPVTVVVRLRSAGCIGISSLDNSEASLRIVFGYYSEWNQIQVQKEVPALLRGPFGWVLSVIIPPLLTKTMGGVWLGQGLSTDGELAMLVRISSTVMSFVLITAALWLATAGPADAYPGVGTGSMIIQVMLAGLLGALFTIKVF